jgi:hypothetical protein
VVEESRFLHPEHLVPLSLVADSTLLRVRLRCTRAELQRIEPFAEIDILGLDREPARDWTDRLARLEVIPEVGAVLIERERLPPGELAVHRGARVCAIDGPVGRVDEFLANAADGRITHLRIRRGRPWGQRDVTVPASQVVRIEAGCVHLNLTRADVAALPHVRVRA